MYISFCFSCATSYISLFFPIQLVSVVPTVCTRSSDPAARRRRTEEAIVLTMSIRRGLRRTILRVRKARATLKTRMACEKRR